MPSFDVRLYHETDKYTEAILVKHSTGRSKVLQETADYGKLVDTSILQLSLTVRPTTVSNCQDATLTLYLNIRDQIVCNIQRRPPVV